MIVRRARGEAGRIVVGVMVDGLEGNVFDDRLETKEMKVDGDGDVEMDVVKGDGEEEKGKNREAVQGVAKVLIESMKVCLSCIY